MKKLFKPIPSDWLYQLVSLFLVTSFTFYLFKFTYEMEIVTNFWEKSEKYHIYTFLAIQFLVKVIFYWVLFQLLKNFVFNKIKLKVLNALNEPATIDNLRTASEIKESIVKFFGLPLRLGMIDRTDLNEEFDLEPEDVHEELEDLMQSVVKWICVFIHLGVTTILVFNLSAYYIIPLLVAVLIAALAFWFGVTILIGNIKLLEKARKELIKKSF